MRWREAHLIRNPAANKGRPFDYSAAISRFLKEHGIEAIWHLTESPGHAGSIAAGLPEGSLVVAVGGDGTVHEVAAACVKTDRVVAVLPIGSGNDYVKALGIGTKLRGALETLAAGKVRAVDVGEVNGVIFNNGLGIGFDAEVAAYVADAPRYLGGFGRYMWSVLRLLANLRCHEASLKLDNGRVIEAKTLLVAIALGTTQGARFRLTPEASLYDGLFDVAWSEEVSQVEVVRLIPAALRGTLHDYPQVHLARTHEIEVEMAEEIPAHVDGELLAPTRNFRARLLPGALRVVAP